MLGHLLIQRFKKNWLLRCKKQFWTLALPDFIRSLKLSSEAAVTPLSEKCLKTATSCSLCSINLSQRQTSRLSLASKNTTSLHASSQLRRCLSECSSSFMARSTWWISQARSSTPHCMTSPSSERWACCCKNQTNTGTFTTHTINQWLFSSSSKKTLWKSAEKTQEMPCSLSI